MNLKTILFCLLAFVVISPAHAQKVKIKKGIAYVDGKAYLNLKEVVGRTITYKNMQEKELFVVQYDSYEKKNPSPPNPRSSAPYKPYVTVTYITLKFLDHDLEFETDITSKKELIKALYLNKVVNQYGEINIENAMRFAKKYGKDISGKRPLQILTY